MSDYYLKPSSPIKKTIEEYCYIFDNYVDSLSGNKDYWLKIIFIDGKFDSVYIPKENVFRHIEERELKLMNLINEEVKRLEKTYESKT